MSRDPVLAWLIGNPGVTAYSSKVANRLLRTQSLMEVLQWAGFEPTHDAAAIIRKLPPGELNATSVQHLRDVLAGEPQSLEWVHILPRLTENVLAALVDVRTRRVCTLDLLIDLVERDPAAAGLLQRTAHLIGVDGRGEAPVFRSSSEFRAWFEATKASRRAAGEQARLRKHEELNRRLGSPIPGNSSIMPLTTVAAIEQHFRALHLNCTPVLTDALAGRCALYLVIEPEQAIAVITLMGRRWQLTDVRGARNCAATTVTRRKVEEWFRGARPTVERHSS